MHPLCYKLNNIYILANIVTNSFLIFFFKHMSFVCLCLSDAATDFDNSRNIIKFLILLICIIQSPHYCVVTLHSCNFFPL